ncbi:MAG: hypothetical protein HYT76_03660 [Deltaproteobacteria bacterium]|nr:hypothetical protein [Deltaproteobacteria bacterium]
MTDIRQKFQQALQDDQNVSLTELQGMEEALREDEAKGFPELTAVLEEGCQDLTRTYDREVVQRFTELTDKGLSQIIVGKTQFVNEARLALMGDKQVSADEWDRVLGAAKSSTLLPPVEAANFSLVEILTHAAMDTQVSAEPDFLRTKIEEVRSRMMPKRVEIPQCIMGSCTQGERESLAEGERLLREGHYDRALTKFSDGHSIYNDPIFIFKIAECLRLQGNIGGAVLYYREFLRTPGLSNHEAIEKMIANLSNRTVVTVINYDAKVAQGRKLLKQITDWVLEVAALIPKARREQDVIKFVNVRSLLVKMQERRRIALETEKEFEKAIKDIDADALRYAVLKLEILHGQVSKLAEEAKNDPGEAVYHTGETTVEWEFPDLPEGEGITTGPFIEVHTGRVGPEPKRW